MQDAHSVFTYVHSHVPDSSAIRSDCLTPSSDLTDWSFWQYNGLTYTTVICTVTSGLGSVQNCSAAEFERFERFLLQRLYYSRDASSFFIGAGGG